MSNDNQNNQFQRRRSDQASRQAAPESRHNDWGHGQADASGSGQAGSNANTNANIGGVPGSQHNDWGHSAVPERMAEQGSRQAAGDAGQSQGRQLPRQGAMPGEEMGHLREPQRPVGKPRS